MNKALRRAPEGSGATKKVVRGETTTGPFPAQQRPKEREVYERQRGLRGWLLKVLRG